MPGLHSSKERPCMGLDPKHCSLDILSYNMYVKPLHQDTNEIVHNSEVSFNEIPYFRLNCMQHWGKRLFNCPYFSFRIRLVYTNQGSRPYQTQLFRLFSQLSYRDMRFQCSGSFYREMKESEIQGMTPAGSKMTVNSPQAAYVLKCCFDMYIVHVHVNVLSASECDV